MQVIQEACLLYFSIFKWLASVANTVCECELLTYCVKAAVNLLY